MVLAVAAVAAFILDRARAGRPLRFFILFALVASSVPLLDTYLHLHWIPQPTRYTAEMELALGMLASVVIVAVWSRLPHKIGIAAAAFLVAIAAEHVAPFLRFTQESTAAIDITRTFEYRVARWVDANLPGQRIMVPGSIAQWLNAFSNAPQLSGASFSTTPNWNEQEAMKIVLTAVHPPETDEAILWLKAFGMQAVATGGLKTPEFWKGVSSTKFDYALPVLWRDQDTTIYRVPHRSTSLAHVIPAGSAGDLRRYVAALEDSSLPLAEFRWQGYRHATVEATVAPQQVVSVQTCYHPGWHASANGGSARTRRDGLGFLLVEPDCNGPCRIELRYDGGIEYIVFRVLSGAALMGVFAYLWRAVRWLKREGQATVNGGLSYKRVSI